MCIGGGPSLTREQCEVVRRARERGACRAIAINNSYQLAPWADICYFADARWWGWHKAREDFKAFGGVKCTIENTGAEVDDGAIHMLRNAGERGLSSMPNAVCTGKNGGYQAVGIAIAAGATRIVLIGYDMKYSGERTNWHSDHQVRVPEVWYRSNYAKHFNELSKMDIGVEIINASIETSLMCFPRMSIEEALQ